MDQRCYSHAFASGGDLASSWTVGKRLIFHKRFEAQLGKATLKTGSWTAKSSRINLSYAALNVVQIKFGKMECA